jgi:hypothetical protein
MYTKCARNIIQSLQKRATSDIKLLNLSVLIQYQSKSFEFKFYLSFIFHLN